MTKLSAIYAKSLTEMVLEKEQDLQAAIVDASLVLEVLSDNDINLFFTHPHTKPEKKIYMLSKILDVGINENISGLIKLSIYKNREKYILDALRQFVKTLKKELNIIEVKVNAPSVLDISQIDKIKAAIKAKLNDDAEVAMNTNHKLIAGVEIAADDVYVNNSVQKYFKEIELLVKGKVEHNETKAG